MSSPVIHIWKNAPFIRFLIPLMAGIILQWHLQIQLIVLWIVCGITLTILASFFVLPFFQRYKLSAINGLAITILFISVGGLLAWYKDIRHDKNWFGSNYSNQVALVLTLQENPVEKTKSYKANASVDFILKDDTSIKTNGSLIIYFKKDSVADKLKYGSKLLLKKSLQEIKNSGNPGGFDYKRYSLFQGITHQVYLKENDFVILPGENKTRFKEFIFSTREKILDILRTNIKGEKELGLAEAC
jgi:competence protein ComEC